jgi:hypothetical protein
VLYLLGLIVGMYRHSYLRRCFFIDLLPAPPRLFVYEMAAQHVVSDEEHDKSEMNNCCYVQEFCDVLKIVHSEGA